MADPVTVWLLSRESVAKSPCKCGSLPGIYRVILVNLSIEGKYPVIPHSKGGITGYNFLQSLITASFASKSRF